MKQTSRFIDTSSTWIFIDTSSTWIFICLFVHEIQLLSRDGFRANKNMQLFKYSHPLSVLSRTEPCHADNKTVALPSSHTANDFIIMYFTGMLTQLIYQRCRRQFFTSAAAENVFVGRRDRCTRLTYGGTSGRDRLSVKDEGQGTYSLRCHNPLRLLLLVYSIRLNVLSPAARKQQDCVYRVHSVRLRDDWLNRANVMNSWLEQCTHRCCTSARL
jgi:hypothetical protein